jgi:hypothetical protein
MMRPESNELAQKHSARWQHTLIRSVTFLLAQFLVQPGHRRV